MYRFPGVFSRGWQSIAKSFASIFAAGLLLAGCETQPGELPGPAASATPEAKGGYVSGVAMLADAKEGGHTGIHVYLAGTQYSANTDENGSYLIAGVSRGTYTVIAEKSGYQTLTVGKAPIDPEANTREHPFVVQTAILERLEDQTTTTGTQAMVKGLGAIIGRVRLQSATVHEGVRVKIEDSPLVTVTDEAGVFRFLNVEPNAYTLKFSYPGYVQEVARARVAEGQEVQVDDVTMQPEPAPTSVAGGAGGAAAGAPTPAAEPISRDRLRGDRQIQGTVELLGPQGQPISDFSRAAIAIENSDYVVTPDPQGRFAFTNLNPGVYRVLGTLDALPPKSVSADLTTAKIAQVLLQLGGATEAQTTAPGIVIGHVVLPGEGNDPLPDASGVSVGLAGSQFVSMTAPDGKFRFEGVPPANYSLAVSREGFLPLRLDNITVAPGLTLDLGEIVMEPKRDYPKVVSTSPAAGATNVTVSEGLVIQLKFSKKMNPDSVKQALSIQPVTAAMIYIGKGGHPYADDDNLVIALSNLDETQPIRFNTNYRIALTDAARDVTGLPLRGGFGFTFRTGAPGVTGTIPREGDSGAFVNQVYQPITIFFNTRLHPDSIRQSSFRIRPSPDTVTEINRQEDSRTGWTTVQLRTQLQDNTNYTVTVERSVKAFNGQPLGNTPYTFRFRTAQPRLLQITPEVVR